MSTQSIGKVITIFISKENSQERIKKNIINIDSKGIKEDKYYSKNINRSILITSIDSYILAKKHNIEIPFGSLGENLLINYNPYHLNSGDKLKIGNIIVEISQNCTICDHLSIIDKNLPNILKTDRGIFAKVIQEGTISIEDQIYILK